MYNAMVRHEILFREDIKNLLLAINAANAALADRISAPEVVIYRAGYVAALRAVATALDIPLVVSAPYIGSFLAIEDGELNVR